MQRVSKPASEVRRKPGSSAYLRRIREITCVSDRAAGFIRQLLPAEAGGPVGSTSAQRWISVCIRRRLASLPLLAVVLIGCHRPATQTSPAFTVTTFVLPDPARRKSVPVYAVVPTAGDRWPVILFSHGNDSGGPAAARLFAAWASHGYLCLAPTHDDHLSLRTAALAAGATDLPPAGLIEPRGAGTDAVLNRARDLSFLIDSADAVEAALPAARGRVDWSRVGVAGHSFGAYTALLLAGQTPDMDDVPRSALDRRPRAFLSLAPIGAGQGGLTDDSWRTIDRPLMNVTGSRDLVPRGQFPDKQKRDPFARSPAGGKVQVTLVGANHGTFLCDPADTFYLKQLGGSAEQQAVLFDDVRRVTTAFWDATLKATADDFRPSNDGRVVIECR